MADTDRRSRARAAIQAVASACNLPTDLTILSERWNTVAELGESDVVAKSATLAHLSRIDPLHWFEQEVRVCGELRATGAMVHVPWSGLQQCVLQDGYPITLWQKVDGETAISSETELVDSLVAVHHKGESIALQQPWFATITVEIPGTLEMLLERNVLASSEIATLNDHLKRLLDHIDRASLPGGFLHGDAQRKNSIHTDDGPIWIDLEETCSGPFAWDLACLTMNPIFDSERVLNRYAEMSGISRVSIDNLVVLKQVRELEGLVWMLAIQDERDQAFRDEMQAQLARVLTVASAD